MVSAATDGRERYDKGGAMAARGNVDERLLDMLRAEPYYSLPLPKTTGRELFGTQYAERIFAWGREHSLSWEDLAATATELTAWSIADAYERYVLPKYKAAELLVGGGGSYNKTLMSRLAARFERFGVEVKTQEDLGYSSDAKEAVARRPLPCGSAEHPAGRHRGGESLGHGQDIASASVSGTAEPMSKAGLSVRYTGSMPRERRKASISALSG